MKLKAIFLILLCVFFAAGDLGAEEMKKKRRKKKKKRGKVVAFKAGQIDVQAGGGFAVNSDYSKSDYSIYGTTETKGGGFVFNGRAEYGVTDFLGIGLWYSMRKDKITITDVTAPTNIYGYEHKYLNICLRPAFHVPLGMAKLDPYVAVPFGSNKVKATPFNNEGGVNLVQDPLDSGFAWAIHGGANYYFTDNIGAFVEGGYGQWLPMVNFGITAKF